MEVQKVDLSPGFKRNTRSPVTGRRIRRVLTVTPSEASAGHVINVNIPNVPKNEAIRPDCIFLVYDFIAGGTKARFMNNLGRLLQSKLTITAAGRTLYQNNYESIYKMYSDLWIPKSIRTSAFMHGVMSENDIKFVSKDDTATGTAALSNVYGTRQELCLSDILFDRGLLATGHIAQQLQFEITLPKDSEILVGSKIDPYTLKNISIEYETIENPKVVNEIMNNYVSGTSMFYKNITAIETSIWGKAKSIITQVVTTPRASMESIVMLFKKTANITDSEEYLDPGITSASVTVGGVTNYVYSSGYPNHRFYDEARRVFERDPTVESEVTAKTFYKDKFAFVVDLRTTNAKHEYAMGQDMTEGKTPIIITLTRKVVTEDLQCYTFVVADAVMNIKNKSIDEVIY